MILCIDFDDTIMDTKNVPIGKRMGEPMPGAVEGIAMLQEAGHTVIIHTVRGGNPQHIEDWCDYYGIEPDGITNIKPNADYYIDDKGLHFDNWQQITNLLAYDEE